MDEHNGQYKQDVAETIEMLIWNAAVEESDIRKVVKAIGKSCKGIKLEDLADLLKVKGAKLKAILKSWITRKKVNATWSKLFLCLKKVNTPSTIAPALEEGAQPAALKEVAQPASLEEVAQPPSLEEVAQPPSLEEVAQPPTPEEVAQPPTPEEVAKPFPLYEKLITALIVSLSVVHMYVFMVMHLCLCVHACVWVYVHACVCVCV